MKKFLKFIGFCFLGCAILIIGNMIIFHNDIEKYNGDQTLLVEKTQHFADSLNNIYVNKTVDIIGDDLLDSLKVNYEKLSNSNKVKFFRKNYKYYRVNKVLHSDEYFINNYDINEMLSICENTIKNNMKNPNSYEFIGYNIKYVSNNEVGDLQIIIKYKGINSFNATVTEEMKFSLDH